MACGIQCWTISINKKGQENFSENIIFSNSNLKKKKKMLSILDHFQVLKKSGLESLGFRGGGTLVAQPWRPLFVCVSSLMSYLITLERLLKSLGWPKKWKKTSTFYKFLSSNHWVHVIPFRSRPSSVHNLCRLFLYHTQKAKNVLNVLV